MPKRGCLEILTLKVKRWGFGVVFPNLPPVCWVTWNTLFNHAGPVKWGSE